MPKRLNFVRPSEQTNHKALEKLPWNRFWLNDTFCDGEDLFGSWNNLSLSDEILTFLGILFNITPAKLLPKYPKKYPSNYFTQGLNGNDSDDESNSNNRGSLIPNDDESNALDDDKNVSQTFNIPLKINNLCFNLSTAISISA